MNERIKQVHETIKEITGEFSTLNERKEVHPNEQKRKELITLTGITTSQINQALKANNPYPARVFLKVDNQEQDIPVFFRIKEKNKRDYSKCFLCGSNDLWSDTKQAFCLECKRPAGSFVFGHQKDWKERKYQCCPSNCCHHLGKKDYFSICYTCYEKVPHKDDLTKPFEKTDPNKPFGPKIIVPGKYHQIVDWNWIIEKQKELEDNWIRPKIKKGSYLQVEGYFSTSPSSDRKSFTAYSYKLSPDFPKEAKMVEPNKERRFF